jgi:hypothetical protein
MLKVNFSWRYVDQSEIGLETGMGVSFDPRMGMKMEMSIR